MTTRERQDKVNELRKEIDGTKGLLKSLEEDKMVVYRSVKDFTDGNGHEKVTLAIDKIKKISSQIESHKKNLVKLEDKVSILHGDDILLKIF